MPAPSSQAAQQRLVQQQLLQGLLRVAAQEEPGLQWASSGRLALQAAAVGLPAPPFAEVFGPRLAAGAFFAPRLLPAAAAPPVHASTGFGATLRSVVITGGLGSLGTLLAGQLLAGAAASRSAPAGEAVHLTLLGRSTGPAALAAALEPLLQRFGSSAACISVVKCDSAAAADVAGVAALRRQCALPDVLIHAAGVLQVHLQAGCCLCCLGRLSCGPQRRRRSR